MWNALVARLILHSLGRTFRRIEWVGALPELPERPIILYANHHAYHDGYLAWYLTHRVLHRPCTVWMADWDRFPLFAAVGAQPFPPDDPARRAATLRRTRRRFEENPSTILVYFPEGRIHPPEEGILPFDTPAMKRLARLYPNAWWWPVAFHLTWRSEAYPTAVLAGGVPHPTITGDEHERLASLWQTVRSSAVRSTTCLLDGRTGLNESLAFTALKPLFERLL